MLLNIFQRDSLWGQGRIVHRHAQQRLRIMSGQVTHQAVGFSRSTKQWISTTAAAAAAAAAATAVILHASSALASEDLTITFRASRNPEIGKAQRALVEAWGERKVAFLNPRLQCPIFPILSVAAYDSSGYVETQFMDPELDHKRWRSELQVGHCAPILKKSPIIRSQLVDSRRSP